MVSDSVRLWQTVDVTRLEHVCPPPFETVTRCPSCATNDAHFLWPGHLVGAEGCIHTRRLCRSCGLNFFQATGLTVNGTNGKG